MSVFYHVTVAHMNDDEKPVHMFAWMRRHEIPPPGWFDPDAMLNDMVDSDAREYIGDVDVDEWVEAKRHADSFGPHGCIRLDRVHYIETLDGPEDDTMTVHLLEVIWWDHTSSQPMHRFIREWSAPTADSRVVAERWELGGRTLRTRQPDPLVDASGLAGVEEDVRD